MSAHPPSVLQSLAERLDTVPAELRGLEALSEAQLAVLDQAVVSAMREQDASLQDALTIALRFVPRPLRGVAKSILFGGDPDA